jgi:hypothetical protein
MKVLKEFEEYIEKRIVQKVKPDLNRSSSLLKEAKKRKVFVRSIKLSDDNANYIIENCYDILLELVRSILFKRGYSSSGHGAHEAEVAFTKTLGLNDADVRFLNELRVKRNGILYYGKDYDKEYSIKTIDFMEKTSILLEEIN